MRFAATFRPTQYPGTDLVSSQSEAIPYRSSVSGPALQILKRYCRRNQIINMLVTTDGRSLFIELNGPLGTVDALISVEAFCKGMSASGADSLAWLEFVDIQHSCRVQSIASHVAPAILNIVVTSARWGEFGLTVECEQLKIRQSPHLSNRSIRNKESSFMLNYSPSATELEDDWLTDHWVTDTLVEVMGKRPLLSVDESKLKTAFAHAAGINPDMIAVRAMAAGVQELFIVIDLSSRQAVARLNHFYLRHRDLVEESVSICRFDDLPHDRQAYWQELMGQSSMTHNSGRLKATARLNPSIAEQY